MELEIHKMLCAATNNVNEHTADMLTINHESVPVTYEKGNYGWFVYVPATHDEMPEECPEELSAILKFAREQGCCWIMFDRDCDPLPGFPEFDW
jgi:hypothetical protein